MNSDSGRTVSLWMNTSELPAEPTLSRDLRVDVAIVGGGMAGMATAYQLVKEGKTVAVLDDGPTAGGETSRTTAHLTFYNDDGLQKVEQRHGVEGLKLSTESHSAAVDLIEQNVAAENIECDFRRTEAYLFVSPNGFGYDFLEKELDAAHRIGLTDAHWAKRAPIPSFDTGKCLCYPRQATFHPTKYLAGLAKAIRRRGSYLFNHTRATEISADGKTAVVRTSTGAAVTAGAVIVATNTPINDRFAIHTKQAPYRTYVVAFRVPRGVYSYNLIWDTDDPYHYVRAHPKDDYDILIVGGEDHKTGQANDPDQRYLRLEQWARARFPEVQGVEYHWSGQVMDTIDYLAFIGRNPGDASNVYIATGDSGMGMTHSHVAAMLLTDLILGRPNPWTDVYDPSRVRAKAIGTWLQENLNVAAQYGDWVTPQPFKEESEIAPDMGAVITRGAHKVAVYRDMEGGLHECSAMCPHLWGVVAWNYAERTWDCPCHGSRFDPYGRVLNGPANEDLPPVGTTVPVPPADKVGATV